MDEKEFRIRFEKKGMLAPFTILTSIFTGGLFPLLGGVIALNMKLIDSIYAEGLILTVLGGFIAHWIFAHSIHDLFTKTIDERATLSKRTLKISMVLSGGILFIIALFLSLSRGWSVMMLAIIGGILCIYAEGLLHHESQMAFGALFLVIGGFYVQVGTLNLAALIWVKILCFALFAFFSQLGWLYFYRLDDYNWDKNLKNKSILVTKSGLIFLVLFFLL